MGPRTAGVVTTATALGRSARPTAAVTARTVTHQRILFEVVVTGYRAPLTLFA